MGAGDRAGQLSPQCPLGLAGNSLLPGTACWGWREETPPVAGRPPPLTILAFQQRLPQPPSEHLPGASGPLGPGRGSRPATSGPFLLLLGTKGGLNRMPWSCWLCPKAPSSCTCRTPTQHPGLCREAFRLGVSGPLGNEHTQAKGVGRAAWPSEGGGLQAKCRLRALSGMEAGPSCPGMSG